MIAMPKSFKLTQSCNTVNVHALHSHNGGIVCRSQRKSSLSALEDEKPAGKSNPVYRLNGDYLYCGDLPFPC